MAVRKKIKKLNMRMEEEKANKTKVRQSIGKRGQVEGRKKSLLENKNM